MITWTTELVRGYIYLKLRMTIINTYTTYTTSLQIGQRLFEGGPLIKEVLQSGEAEAE